MLITSRFIKYTDGYWIRKQRRIDSGVTRSRHNSNHLTKVLFALARSPIMEALESWNDSYRLRLTHGSWSVEPCGTAIWYGFVGVS